jgi:phosphoglucomutase
MIDKIKKAGEAGSLLPESVKNLEAWLGGDFLPEWARKSIEELVDSERWEELNDRFFMTMAFGTGGMRGRTVGNFITKAEQGSNPVGGSPERPGAGSNFLNDINVIRATMALYRYTAQYLKETGQFDAPKLVIAHDVRYFSRHFCELSTSVWTQMGGQAFMFEGPRSTPQLSFTVRYLKAHTGIVITASHNPPHDNGYKVYFSDGAQVVSPHAEAIIENVGKIELSETAAYFKKDISKVVTLPASVDDAYLTTVEDVILDPEVVSKSSPKIVFTPIHGTGGVASMPLLEELGVDVVTVPEQDIMDGGFPTVKSPNPENAEALAMGIAKAKEVGADAVIATDPDCDRVGVAVPGKDGEMVLLSGNQTGAMLAEYRIRKLKEYQVLPEEGCENSAVIKTFVTSPIFEAIAKKHGLKLINTLTGFKWIGEKLNIYEQQMKQSLYDEEGIGLDYDNTEFTTRAELLREYSTFYVFGGEESYGYLPGDLVRDKDGNAAAVCFAELAGYLKSEGKSFLEFLDEMYLDYGYYLENILNIYYEGASGAAKIKSIISSYRSDPPKAVGEYKIAKVTDFGIEDLVDADGKSIPKQDFYFFEFENGYSCAARASGTEPKIKFYMFAREDVSSAAELPAIKEATKVTLDSIKAALDKDARERAER